MQIRKLIKLKQFGSLSMIQLKISHKGVHDDEMNIKISRGECGL